MLSTLKLQALTSAAIGGRFFPSPPGSTNLIRYPYNLRLLGRSSRYLCIRSQYAAAEPLITSHFTASVGTSSLSPPSQWNFTYRHIVVLNVIVCSVAVSATWLFFSAIPTLLAFKKAAESLEKLMDVTREELPDTMAAVRLSGMEISDLGQEITQGVRSSTRAVRVAEERLRHLKNTSPSGFPVTFVLVNWQFGSRAMNFTWLATVQEVANLKTETSGPLLARSARGIRESIIKGRAVLQTFLALIRFSILALNFFNVRRAKRLVG